MDENTRRKICRLIAGLVVVDDDLDAAEESFIDNMLERFGLSCESRSELFPIMDGKEAAEELTALPKEVQLEAFDLLVQAAAADKRFVDEEKVYLRHVAKVVGVSDDELDKRVADAIGE